jgi:hypothetical protein
MWPFRKKPEKVPEKDKTLVPFGWSQWTFILREAAVRGGLVPEGLTNYSLCVVGSNGKIYASMKWGEGGSTYMLGADFWMGVLLDEAVRLRRTLRIANHPDGARLQVQCFQEDASRGSFSCWRDNFSRPPTGLEEQAPETADPLEPDPPIEPPSDTPDEAPSLYDHLNDD